MRVRLRDRDERRARLHHEGRPLPRRIGETARVTEHVAHGFPAPSLAGWARDGPDRPAPAILIIGVALAALAATAGAVYLSAVSKHAPNPEGHAALSVVVCLSFVGAGLLALRRPPYVGFGPLLAAVGFSSLLGALHDANGAIPYTIGVLTANVRSVSARP